MQVWGGWCQALYGGAQGQDEKKWSYTKTQEVSSQHEEEFYRESGRALEQAVQEGHVISLSGNIQNPPEHVPVFPALGDLALAERLDRMISRGSFKP